ncbi:restriction endonuclease subunit S [Ruegeria atlantica]|uniref:restriction endonuclease subunit S n=1 Tax=Ruegeria atlantica TaxID=81569 RepID=UPI00147A7A85|nr:restriction endonuclease subunit S [Ruegeria atlantica]
MAEWNDTTLGEFISLQRGHDLPTTTREKGDIPVMGSFGVTGSHSVARAKGPGVTVGRSGASIGVVSYVDVDYWPLNTCLFATDFHGNNPRFAYYFLQTLDLASHNSGSAQPSLNRNYIAPIRISVPDRDTQDDIAGFLGCVDDKIELNRRMNETLESMAQAIFRDWFVDFGPTRRKMEGATDPVVILGGLIPIPEKAAPLATLFPATLGDDGLPEGWSQKSLDEIAEQEKASVKPQDAPDELFEHFSIPAFDSGKSPAMDLGETIRSNKTLIPEGAVLLSKLNPEIQRVWLPRKKDEHRQICSTEFLVYTPREPFGPAYLYSQFSERGFRNLLTGMVTGTSKSHQRVAPKALATRLVVAPDKGPVRAFEEIAASLLDRALHNQAENNTLAATRDLLMPKLMSGEVRLREAEAVA